MDSAGIQRVASPQRKGSVGGGGYAALQDRHVAEMKITSQKLREAEEDRDRIKEINDEREAELEELASTINLLVDQNEAMQQQVHSLFLANF